METSAALEIWNRSIAKHQLVYGTYIGDGDSSSFRNLTKSDPYNGEVLVRKEECLGIAQKRLKKHLLKKSSLCKELPDSNAKRIAHLYVLVVVQNRGKEAADIRDALNVLLEHTREQHNNCPAGESSWCYYQKRLLVVSRTIPYQHHIPDLLIWHQTSTSELERYLTCLRPWNSAALLL